MEAPDKEMWDEQLRQYVPFDPGKAADMALSVGSLQVREYLTPAEVIEKYGELLTEEQIKQLRSWK